MSILASLENAIITATSGHLTQVIEKGLEAEEAKSSFLAEFIKEHPEFDAIQESIIKLVPVVITFAIKYFIK